jgi:hypothetical protein
LGSHSGVEEDSNLLGYETASIFRVVQKEWNAMMIA